MRNFSARMITAAAAVMTMGMQALASDIVVTDVEFVGLNRVTAESLQGVVPSVGQLLTEEGLAESIRALYETENFSDVQTYLNGTQIVYQVVERPIIAEVNFDGNRLIPKEALEQGLKQAGLAVGYVLKQATVHNIATELENQYISQGYYNSNIKVTQTQLEGNRVKLDLMFFEDKPAKVVDINVIGNQAFSNEDIKDVMALKEKGWNPLSSSSRYAQEKLAASLESVKAMYLNEGYVRFEIDDAVLNINEEKDSVFVELKVSEGEKYNFSDTQFLGNVHYPLEELKPLIKYEVGTQYSQTKLDETAQAIASKFGDDGYYNAQIRPVRRIDDTNKTVAVDYYIDPMRPVTVRRINFTGNTKTKDEVLRREMRQLEGALASNQKIQLSRARLMRTGFFKNVTVETKPVVGTPDQMDVNFIVEEQPSGSTTAAVGYSQSGGVTFQFGLSQSNFMGTGKKVTADFSRSETRDSYNLGVTDPYFTVNGVSQSIGGYYRKTKYDSKNISNYVLDSYGGTLSYGYPIDEKQRISGGINLDSTKVRGGPYMGIGNVAQLMEQGGQANDLGTSPNFQKDYKSANAIVGWSYSSLDKPVFPTKGMSHELDLTFGFGDHNYQKVTYKGNAYYPLWKGSILRGYTKLGYGNDLPFYESFYAGGYGSVRGYDASSLGPQSQAYAYLANSQRTVRGEIVGGNAMATFGTELILPMPFKGDWTEQVRPVIFFEGGQVFETSDLKDRTIDATLAAQLGLPASAVGEKLIKTDDELRYAAGIGATWYTPIGPLSISYSKPINSQDGDKTEKVQFQIGSVF